MRALIYCLLPLAAIALPPIEARADLVKDLLACVEITVGAKRLVCYDRAVAGKQAETTKSKIIADFSGQGAGSTRPFTTIGPWEVQWQASGMIFQIFLHTAKGGLVNVIANQGAGGGTSYQPKRGNYFLKINAMGSWTVRVVSLP